MRDRIHHDRPAELGRRVAQHQAVGTRQDQTDIGEVECILANNAASAGHRAAATSKVGEQDIRPKRWRSDCPTDARTASWCAAALRSRDRAASAGRGASQLRDVRPEQDGRRSKGTVTEFQWTNPHSFLEIDAPGPTARTAHWSIELNSPNNLTRQGWSAQCREAGRRQVSVTFNPLRDGKPRRPVQFSACCRTARCLAEAAFAGGRPVNMPGSN